jgi:hypothetical protein
VRHSFRPFIFLPLSAVLSPWQARYFFDSIRLKLAWRGAMHAP